MSDTTEVMMKGAGTVETDAQYTARALSALKLGQVIPGVEIIRGVIEPFPGSGQWGHFFELRLAGVSDPVTIHFTAAFPSGDQNRPSGEWYLMGQTEPDAEFFSWVSEELRAGRTPPGVLVCGKLDAAHWYVQIGGFRGVQVLEVGK